MRMKAKEFYDNRYILEQESESCLSTHWLNWRLIRFIFEATLTREFSSPKLEFHHWAEWEVSYIFATFWQQFAKYNTAKTRHPHNSFAADNTYTNKIELPTTLPPSNLKKYFKMSVHKLFHSVEVILTIGSNNNFQRNIFLFVSDNSKSHFNSS